MKRILFPTDFSNSAEAAFNYAVKFAEVFNAEIIVLHVYDLPIIDTPVMPETTQEVLNVVEKNQFNSFKAELAELEKRVAKKGLDTISLRTVLLYGSLTYNVNKVCEDEDIDLVIMGTTGASGLKEVFLGSNTASVIKNISVPVLAIPTAAEFHHQIKSIVFTTEYKTSDKEALDELLVIAKKIGAKVYCLHIKKEDDSDNVEHSINEWKIKYKNEDIDFFNIAEDHTEQTILDFVQNQHIDMLSMQKHKRNFFESLFHQSLTKKMAYHSKVPILIFQED